MIPRNSNVARVSGFVQHWNIKMHRASAFPNIIYYGFDNTQIAYLFPPYFRVCSFRDQFARHYHPLVISSNMQHPTSHYIDPVFRCIHIHISTFYRFRGFWTSSRFWLILLFYTNSSIWLLIEILCVLYKAAKSII